MRSSLAWAISAGIVAVVPVLAPIPARSATYVIPHVLEVQGRISTTQYTFDQILYALYAAGLAGTPPGAGALLDLYLYDNSAGNPLQNFGVDVCNPCSYDLGIAGPPKASIAIEPLIDLGAGFDAGVKLGFAVIAVSGDADAVTLESDLLHSHTGPFDLSILSVPPARLRAEDPGAPNARIFVVPHLFEQAGKITNTQYTFDQAYYAVYTAGLAGTAAGPGASFDLYLYDNTGATPLRNNGMDVCNPCSYTLGGANPRKRTIIVDDLITAKGGNFDTGIKLGSAVFVVGGDPGNVTLGAMTTNSKTSAFDLDFSSTAPRPVIVTGALAVLLEPHPGLAGSLRVSPNPARSEFDLAFDLDEAADVELALYDVAGRRVATILSGRVSAGRHERRWSAGRGLGAPLPGGMYFARLSAGDGSAVTRVVLIP